MTGIMGCELKKGDGDKKEEDELIEMAGFGVYRVN